LTFKVMHHVTIRSRDRSVWFTTPIGVGIRDIKPQTFGDKAPTVHVIGHVTNGLTVYGFL